MRLGVVVNKKAGRIRREPQLIGRLQRVAGRDAVFATSSAEELPRALAALRERGTDTLLVVGGDGTVTGTLTPLLRSWPDHTLPAVALTRGGTVNTIAKSLGSSGPPDRVAARLLDRGDARSRRTTPIVQVNADGGAPHYGIVFVNGVGVRWLEMYHNDSRRGLRGAAAVTGRIVGSAIFQGETARRMFSSFRAQLTVDETAIPPRDYTVMAAASIPEVGLGFAPFYTAGTNPQRIHLATTNASAGRFVLEMPALLVGREPARSAVRHFSPSETQILSDSAQAWSLDAESFPPARHVTVRAGPPLDFISADGDQR
jgi:diacylglycerol kinase family enzyme